MKIRDHVMVVDEDIKGIVTQINNKEVTIVTDDGFEFVYSENQLVVIDNELQQTVSSSHDFSAIVSEKESKPRKPKLKNKTKDKRLPPMEVDLHIHQLTANQKGMTKHDMLNLQIDTAKRQLEFAISKRIQRVVFVHGVGEGVLKAELEYLFRKYDNIDYFDADYQKYGRGATEVYIFQNKK